PTATRLRRSTWVVVLTGCLTCLLAGVALLAWFWPTGQPEPEKVRPSVPSPRIPSPEDPLGWIARLGQPPRSLTWPGQSPEEANSGTWTWEPRKLRALVVTSRGCYLLALGEVKSSSFDLAVDIDRPSWLGEVGLFLGFRVADHQGRRRAEMQIF